MDESNKITSPVQQVCGIAYVGDSSRRSEKIVKIWNCAFRCDYYFINNESKLS